MTSKKIRRIVLSAVLIAGAAAAFLVQSCASEPSTVTLKPVRYQARHVIIVVLDGLRSDEGFGDPSRRHIPHLDKELAPAGARCSNFWNDGPTYTLAGHTALSTGCYQDIANDGTELPARPGIFQYWLRASGSPKSAAWVIASKDKIRIIADTKRRAWNGQFTPSVNTGIDGSGSGYRSDGDTLSTVMKTLSRDKPRLMLINFRDPDQSGHSGSRELYLSAVESSDENASKLWRWLQSDPEFRDSTDIFFTSDHGRHSDGVRSGFVSHGDRCEGCRRIWLLAMGPDFKKGFVSDMRGQQIDIPATAAELLGFSIPGTKGRVLTELFENSKSPAK